MALAASLLPDLDGHWFSVREDDRRALGLYLRHYSSSKARGSRTPTPLRGNAAKFVGPGSSLVLMTPGSDALFVTSRSSTTPRYAASAIPAAASSRPAGRCAGATRTGA